MGFSKRVVGGLVISGLFAGIVLAQSGSYNFKQNGNLMGAYASAWGSNCSVNAQITPGTTEQNEDAYEVYWSVSFHGVSPYSLPTSCPNSEYTSWPYTSVYMVVSGILDASAVKGNSSSGISVDLDISKLRSITSAVRADCSCGYYCYCTYTPLQSFPLKGTFTPKTTGYGAQTYSRSGNNDNEYIDSVCKYTYSFNGNESGGSAIFSGNVGSVAMTEPSIGSNAYYRWQKGQLRRTYECNLNR